MKTIKIGLKKSFECPDGHFAEYWQLANYTCPYNEHLETSFKRNKIWSQSLLLYNDIDSLINNYRSTGVKLTVDVPYWVSDANNSNWGNELVERIKKICAFFADAEVITYEVDETQNESYRFKIESRTFYMLPDGSVING